MSEKFQRSEIFEDIEYVETYRKNRWIPSSVFDVYIDLILDSLPEHKRKDNLRILDIGCGTGQFAIRIATSPRLTVSNVDAIDSSQRKNNLLCQYLEKNNILNIQPHLSDISNYRTNNRYDIITCSEMIHLVDDVKSFFQNVANLLSEDGVFLIRTSTHEQLYYRKWYNPFPQCRYIDICRHKSKWLLKACSDIVGFSSFDEVEIDESHTINTLEYIERFEQKSYSTLHFLSDEEHKRGLNLLKNKLKNTEKILFDYKMTSYVIRK